MNDLVLLRDALLAGEGFAAATLLPILAWLVASVFPKRAALRHLIWLMAFTGLLVLPALALLLPARVVIRQPAIPPMTAGISSLPPHLVTRDAAFVPRVSHLGSTQKIGDEPALTGAIMPIPRHLGPAQLAAGAFVLWLFGFAVILLYRAMALLGLSRLRRRSTSRMMPTSELQGRWQLRIAKQPGIHGPLTWGIFRPVIFLPQSAAHWSSTRLTAALRHEIAHVRRHDMATQMLAQFVCALYWPNPLVWLGARRLRREAEIAADDAVLSAGVKPSIYAETLMALAAEFRGHSPGFAMAAPSTLEARITYVLNSAQSRIGVTAMDALKAACLGAGAVAAIALVRPDLAVAQSAKTETVMVQADNLPGIWKVGIPVWVDPVGLELKFGPMTDEFCRMDGPHGDIHIYCYEPYLLANGDVTFEGNHIHLAWGTMMVRGVVDATQVSPGILAGSFAVKVAGIPFHAPDRLTKILPSQNAPDAGGNSALLVKTLNGIEAGGPIPSLAPVGRTEPPTAGELRALGPLVSVVYLGHTLSSRDDWALRKDEPGKQDVQKHLEQIPDDNRMNVYAVEFSAGERICGIRERSDGAVPLRCV